MKADVKIEGVDDVVAQLSKLGDLGESEAFKAIHASLYRVHGVAVKKIMQGPKSGRIYERTKGRNLSTTHQASAPGQPPATDTGVLASSIYVKKTGRLSGQVGTDKEYGFWLEYGTRSIEPRPWLAPSLDENRDWILDKFRKALDKAVKGAQ